MRPSPVILLTAVLAGCATPVGVTRVGFRAVYQQITTNALVDGVPSETTRTILDRHGLLEPFESDPVAVLEELHAIAWKEVRREYLSALAELSYLTALRLESKEWFLASTAYAYFYLFGEEMSGLQDPFDPRFRLASDLYNAALSQYLRDEDGNVALIEGVHRLPFGSITIETSTDRFPEAEKVDRFLPAMDFELRGLRIRNRRAGLGVSLIAVSRSEAEKKSASPNDSRAVNSKRAASALLTLKRLGSDEKRIRLEGRLEILDPRHTKTVQINGRDIPLEADLSAPLAYALQASRLWDFEVRGLFSGELEQFRPGIYMFEPYAPGKIPVVFVHGTASSPARWADTFNSLEAYSLLREKYQYWFFIYTTGNPIPYSANILRQSLRNIVDDVDPEGRDPALRQMVLVGHIQGGLLMKMLVADSGMDLWESLLKQGVDPSKLSPENQELLKEVLIFERCSFVSRVAFVATPHLGSFLAARWYSKLGSSMISLPTRLLDVGKDVFSKTRSLEDELGGHVPTSLDNMDPSSPFIQTLAAIPLHAEVKAHSIIAVKGSGPIEEGDDGVVEYQSAHIEGVESEIIVPSSHSCQSHPATVQELRRILLEHLREVTAKA